jgi:hypothetical protein
MASKYAGLKGRVPEQPTIRDQALQAALDERKQKSVAELTEEYNQAKAEAVEMANKAKVLKVKADALEILIRRKLDSEDADAIRINGYTWSETFEPYPVCDDVEAVLKYFHDPANGMEDQLRLKSSEIAERLKNFVKAEAQANELVIEEKEVEDPDAPEGKRTIQEVRSNIPGVKVFLKAGLSRVKSKGAKA